MADSPTQHGDQDTQAAILKLTEQVMNLMTIFTQNQTPPAAASSTTVTSTFDSSKLMDTISSRIPMFTYVPEEEKTFEVWFNRYEEIVTKDGAQLADDTKTRVILAKLSPTDYAHYTNRILPKVPNELSFNETIGLLKTTFKSTTSVFRKRQEFLRSEYSGGSLEEYTGSILRGYTSSEFKKMSDDQLCCLIWINGMKDNSYQDIRTRALQVLEQKPRITLLEMEAEVKRVLDIRADSKAVAPSNQSPEVQAVQKKPQNQHNQNKTEKQPPSPCYRCGGNHWSKDYRNRKMEEQFNNQHGAMPRHFVVNQKVYVKDYRYPKATWIPGIIIRKLGGTIYDVRADDKTWRRHANQLRTRSSATACQEAADLLEMPIRFTQEPITEPVTPPPSTIPPLPTNPIVPSQAASPSPPPLRRSSRNVHPPKRLCMDPKKKSYHR
ncbi:hypothetical protein CRE_02317 [Caenorhabditis remanei]|uniref:DUF7083 domain-containing protein n=1 Tax=Caenorhabditis remanei TaxID=31234 RepID=E3LG78_CAERE|nr:hypothetical protein CRE_02317 [Caenorhabditis remanei]